MMKGVVVALLFSLLVNFALAESQVRVPSFVWSGSSSSDHNIVRWARPVPESAVVRCFARLVTGSDCQFIEGGISLRPKSTAVVVVHDSLRTEQFVKEAGAFASSPDGGAFRYLRKALDASQFHIEFPSTTPEDDFELVSELRNQIDVKPIVASTDAVVDSNVVSMASLEYLLLNRNWEKRAPLTAVIYLSESQETFATIDRVLSIISEKSGGDFVALATSSAPLVASNFYWLGKNHSNGTVPGYNGEYKNHWPKALLNAYWIVAVFGFLFFYGIYRMVVMQGPTKFQPYVEGGRFSGGGGR